MYTIDEADPSIDNCNGHHEWTEIEAGSILWRCCNKCSFTQCTLPGVDRCYHEPQENTTREEWGKMVNYERLLYSFLEHTSCTTLTTVRCPTCGTSFCSDHLALHYPLWCDMVIK